MAKIKVPSFFLGHGVLLSTVYVFSHFFTCEWGQSWRGYPATVPRMHPITNRWCSSHTI